VVLDWAPEIRMSAVAITRDELRRLLRSRAAVQAATFTGASLVANLLAVVSTAMVTRNLGASEFGSYSFAVSLLVFVALFFEFGLFLPAARLAAVTERQDRREVIGTALLVYLPVGALFSVTIFVLSFWIDRWFNVDAGNALRVAAPVAGAIPFVFVLQQLAQGVDRLHVSSFTSVLTQLLLVVLLGSWLVIGEGLSSSSTLVLRATAFLLAGVAGAFWLRPLLGAFGNRAVELVRQARQWGFQLFIGRVLSIGTYNMDVLMLGLWTTPRWVGLYVLAGSLATASGLPVLGLASALFSRMAREPAIDRRWLIIASSIGVASTIGVTLVAEPLIRLLFSSRYAAAAGLVFPLALAQLVRGVTTVFNTFLSAHAHGAALRNAGIVLTVSNVGLNFALIPPFGAQGAAWASLLALVANLVAHVFFYRRSYAL
jgi:O-antigen/teichoic acid export membrane protein